MSKIDDLIAKKSNDNPNFSNEARQAGDRLEAAVFLMKLREGEGLTQRELAERVGKPQSTIARIESGSMDVSFRVLNEIARSLGKRIELRIVS